MNKEETKRLAGTWVKVSDVILSIPSSGYSHLEADVHIPSGVTLIDMDAYTKEVQDDMMDALREVSLMNEFDTRKVILGDNRTSLILTIEKSSGHEFMERYEKWKSNEEHKLKQEQIEAAKKLLIENGFKVI